VSLVVRLVIRVETCDNFLTNHTVVRNHVLLLGSVDTFRPALFDVTDHILCRMLGDESETSRVVEMVTRVKQFLIFQSAEFTLAVVSS
jgi:hypothetical protein